MKNIIKVLFGIPVILSIQPLPEKQPIDLLLEKLAETNNYYSEATLGKNCDCETYCENQIFFLLNN
tara:strand:- start:83 stop:280 length:198 start_codon:yes stop_codon:yes gene_type:complete